MSKKKKNRKRPYKLGVIYARIYIDGCPTSYFLSPNGYIINTNYRMSHKTKVLKMQRDQNGYLSVRLYRNNKSKMYKIARLVAQYFIPNPENKLEVNHIDGDKDHNYASNLEWVTRKENMVHAVRTGLHRSLKGKDHPNLKNDLKIVEKACKMLSEGTYSIKQIHEKTGLSSTNINNILQGTSHRSISSKYNFEKYRSNKLNRFEHAGKYTLSQIHEVCQELVNNTLSMNQISEKTGVSYATVKSIRLRKRHVKISSQYDFNHYDKIR